MMPEAAVCCFAAAVPAQTCCRWLAEIDARYARAGPDDPAFRVTASSLRVTDVPGLDLDALARVVLRGEVGARVRARLGARPLCNADQCWVRRQPAPRRAPPLHRPHAWHQDGALGFDFLARAPGAGDLLEMLTCWLPLVPCGSEAPGLEWLATPVQRLLRPEELADEALRHSHPGHRFSAPSLAAGDLLLFDGSLVHRTHVRPTMTLDRTSIELRFFPAGAPPGRLAGQRFQVMPDR